MSNGLKPISVPFLIIGLLIGAGGVYYYSSNTYQPQIEALETQVYNLNSSTQASIDELNKQVSFLEESNYQKDDDISILESYLIKVENELSDTKTELIRSRTSLENEIFDLEELLRDSYEFARAHPIQIGLTSRTSSYIEYTQAVKEIAEKDINEYCREQGVPYRFQFVIRDNEGKLESTSENTALYNLFDVNLIVGHGYSTQCYDTLDYVKANNILLLSPTSLSHILSIEDDNLFRVSPPEKGVLDPLCACLVGQGIESIIVLHRNDVWGSYVSEGLVEKFEAQGGIVYKVIAFPKRLRSFMETLRNLESVASKAVVEYGSGNVGIVLISFDEAGSILKYVHVYRTLTNLTWFGYGDTVGLAEKFYFPSLSESIKLLSPFPGRNSTLFYDFAEKMYNHSELEVNFYDAAMYDACWLYALSVIDVRSTNTSLIKEVLPVIAETYEGATGVCALDEFGDRVKADYHIWGLALEEGKIVDKLFGYYYSDSDSISWVTESASVPLGEYEKRVRSDSIETWNRSYEVKQ